MLIVFLLCVITYASDENLKRDVFNAVKRQMIKEYTNSLTSDFVRSQNITQSREYRLKQLKGAIAFNEAKKVNITKEIQGVENKIKSLQEQMKKVNSTIYLAKENAAKERKDVTIELKHKIEAYNKAMKELKELEEKKDKLNDMKLDTIRAMAAAREHIAAITEEMRNRRRFLNDLEIKHNNKKRTIEVVSKVRQLEYQKLIKRIKELEDAKDEIRRLEQAQEMKQKAIEKREEQIRVENERKRKILYAKLEAAKIAKNAELIAQVYKQLAELKRYKLRQISCARKAFEDYKLKQRILIEKKKAKLIDAKLKNEFTEKKGEYLMNVKREIQDKIDELRLEKELFEKERVLEEKKLKEYAKIQATEIKDSKKRLQSKKMLMKMKREELMRQRMRTMLSQAQEYDNKVKKNILRKAVNSSKSMIRKADRMNQNLRKLNTEILMKKRILSLKSQDATIASAKERMEIQKLKDQFYKLAALRHRQNMQINAGEAILKHEEKMDDLEEAERQGNLEMFTELLRRRGVQKSLIKHAKQNAKEQMKTLRKQMKKEYELKKKIISLKRCLRTRLALNNEIAKKQFEQKLRRAVKQALINRLRADMPLKCTGKNELAKRLIKNKK